MTYNIVICCLLVGDLKAFMDFRKSGGMAYLSPTETQGKARAATVPHGTILFPTWHRPYLTMMEVRLGPLLRDYLPPPNLPFQSQSNLMRTWPSKVSTTVC